MERFIKLNLRTDGEKTEAGDLPKQENQDSTPPIVGKRLNRILNRAAHKAASEFGRNKSGIFSK